VICRPLERPYSRLVAGRQDLHFRNRLDVQLRRAALLPVSIVETPSIIVLLSPPPRRDRPCR
jgi:hypothetical protein